MCRRVLLHIKKEGENDFQFFVHSFCLFRAFPNVSLDIRRIVNKQVQNLFRLNNLFFNQNFLILVFVSLLLLLFVGRSFLEHLLSLLVDRKTFYFVFSVSKKIVHTHTHTLSQNALTLTLIKATGSAWQRLLLGCIFLRSRPNVKSV